ncbi:MAG: glycosyltransferase family 39 protein, partial [Caldilineaceae bacterium]|nr:glycosyltransferase family 39 protein [Caldilineaceae bacterium]
MNSWISPSGRARAALLAVLLGLLALSLALRLWRLDAIPPGFFIDEGAYGVDALDVLNGKHSPFFPRNYGREGLMIYAIAGAIEIFGRTILAVRLPSALAGALAPVTVYWLAQILFADDRRPHRARWIGITAAAAMAVSTWLVLMSRGTIRANFLMLLLPLALGFLWRGIERKSLWRMAVAGALIGVLAYTYIAARFVPIFLLIFGATFIFSATGMRGAWQRWRQWVAFGVAALVTATPLLVYFAMHPDHFLLRSQDLWVFARPDALRLFVWNIGVHLAAFGFVADPYWRHNVADMPLLNLGEAAFFWLGLGIAVVRWRRPVYRLLVTWLLVMMMPAFLAVEMSPNALRGLGAAPAVFLLLGLGLWEAATWLRGRSLLPPAATTARLVGAVLVGLVAVRLHATVTKYFGVWAEDPRTAWEFYDEWRNLAASLNQIEDEDETLYVIPTRGNFDDPYRPYHFNYLYTNQMPVVSIHTQIAPDAAVLYDAVRSAWPLRQVKVVDWIEGMHWNGDAERRIPFLLNKYGRMVDRADLGEYAVETYTDLSVAAPWTYADHPAAVDVIYDAGVQLQTLAYGAGGADFAVTEAENGTLTTHPGATLWIVAQWQADQTPAVDLKASWRLVDADGGDRFQFDDALVGSDGLLTSEWTPGAPTQNFYTGVLPPDLSPGCYALHLIVYDAVGLTPTV